MMIARLLRVLKICVRRALSKILLFACWVILHAFLSSVFLFCLFFFFFFFCTFITGSQNLCSSCLVQNLTLCMLGNFACFFVVCFFVLSFFFFFFFLVFFLCFFFF